MADKKNVYIFAGGGSGGHLFPGISVAEAICELDSNAHIIFLCTTRAIDKSILEPRGWNYETQPVEPVPVRKPWRLGRFLRNWKTSKAICRRIIEENKPVAVVSLGGFASGAAMCQAFRMKKRYGHKLAMLNPDAVPGKANIHCAKYSERIFMQWEMSKDHFKSTFQDRCIASGCPIRPMFSQARPDIHAAREAIGFSPDKKLLVIVGGSLGGRNVNQAAAIAIPQLKKDGVLDGWQVLHIAGNTDYQRAVDDYAQINADDRPVVWEFAQNMDEVLMAADLVIGRAGASTLAELTAVGVPSILIPYPYHKDQHQLKNARMLEQAGAARIVNDDCNSESTARQLVDCLKQVIQGDILAGMAEAAKSIGRPDAAKTIANELIR